MDLLNIFLQFLQDKGGKEKAHKIFYDSVKYRFCILLLATGMFLVMLRQKYISQMYQANQAILCISTIYYHIHITTSSPSHSLGRVLLCVHYAGRLIMVTRLLNQ